MRRWKSQMALFLSGVMAVTSIAPASGIISLAAEPFAETSHTSGERSSTPFNGNKASSSDAEKATPAVAHRKDLRIYENGPVKYVRKDDFVDSYAGWGPWWEDYTVGSDRNEHGGPLALKLPGGKVKNFSRGLAANSLAGADIDVSDYQGQYFFALAGVEAGTGGTCTFKVLTSKGGNDWEVQWYSNGIMNGNDEAREVLIKIPENAVKLRLEIGDGGNGNGNDHGIWASASIIADKAAVSTMGDVTISVPTYLGVDQEGEISVDAFSINGKRIDDENLTIQVESDNEDVVTVSADNNVWKLTGTGDGTANVTVTVEKDGVTEEKEFLVIAGIGDDSTWRAESPDGSQTLLFLLNSQNGLNYIAIKDGEAVVNMSSAGIKTSVGDFTSGLTYVGENLETIEDSYDLLGAKTSHVENEATEFTLNFEKEDAKFDVIARVYDDGFALRYRIPEAGDAKEVSISEEFTSFVLPQDSISYAMKYTPWHEEAPHKKTNSELTGEYAMALLYKTKEGTLGLISEAALNGSYCGGMLKGQGGGVVDVKFAPEQNKAVTAALPFESPWRFAVVGDAAAINENTMSENLSPECKLEDTSWIKPGVTGWTWLNEDPCDNPNVYKKYIDMAAEMGWSYVLMDDGWQRGQGWNKITDDKGTIEYKGFPNWLEDLVAYGEERGVGLLAWAANGDFDNSDKIRALELWAEKGIKGIKIDFFNSANQDTIKKYNALMEKTAECHLLLNPHGSNITTGERRTWPQTLTREGILGAEQHRQGGWESLTAEYACLIPFTRNAVGPADFTPLMSYYKNWKDGNAFKNTFTVSQMAAFSIVYESGIMCLADKPAVYLNSPAKSLLQNLPVSWDESHLLEGEPGDYVSIARRSDDDWYVGIICNKERDAEVALDFLENGRTYYAAIYQDGENKEEIEVDLRPVTSEDVLSIPLAKAGGASVKITADAPSMPERITLNPVEILMTENETAVINAAVYPEKTTFDHIIWKSSNERVATVKDGTIKALKPGKATITAFAGVEGNVSASCEVTVAWQPFRLDKDTWAIRNDNGNWKLNSESSLTIISEEGEYGNSVSNAKNVFFTDVAGDFAVSVKLAFEPEANFQSAGIIIYAADRNVFEALRRYHGNFGGRCFAAVNIANGNFLSEKTVKDEYQGKEVYLKVVRTGTMCTAYVSEDNENWAMIGTPVTNDSLAGVNLKIGLYSVNGAGKDGSIPAVFEAFTLEQDGESKVVPFAKTTDAELEQLKIKLDEIIQSCKVYEEEIYTEDSYAVLKEALCAAGEALAEDASKETLVECYNALKRAIDGLITKEEIELKKLRANLIELINSCTEYEEDLYTGSSFAALRFAVKMAEEAIARDESGEILTMRYEALKAAVDGLVKREDTGDKELDKLKAKLAGLIGSCAQYEEKTYTKSSFAALKGALAEAGKVLEDENSTKTELADCYEKLLKAAENLEKAKEHGSSSGGGSDSSGSYKSTASSEPQWVQDAKGWWIRNKDGSYPKEQWASMIENGKTVWYYFGADGYMKDGWITVNGKTFFLHNVMDGTRGAMYTGWHLIDGKWYYFEEKEGADQGKMLIDCVTPDGYQLDVNGVWVQ